MEFEKPSEPEVFELIKSIRTQMDEEFRGPHGLVPPPKKQHAIVPKLSSAQLKHINKPTNSNNSHWNQPKQLKQLKQLKKLKQQAHQIHQKRKK